MSKLVVFICIKNINNINCKYCKQYCGHNKNYLSEYPHRLCSIHSIYMDTQPTEININISTVITINYRPHALLNNINCLVM